MDHLQVPKKFGLGNAYHLLIFLRIIKCGVFRVYYESDFRVLKSSLNAYVYVVEMNDICVSWQQKRYCYAHEQCRLATRQWSRLLDSMLSVGLVKDSPFCGPSIDPCLTRLVNSADYDSVISCGSARSDNGGTPDCELMSCKRCCSDEEDTSPRHGLRSNGFTPWKSDTKIYSPGVKGYCMFIVDRHCTKGQLLYQSSYAKCYFPCMLTETNDRCTVYSMKILKGKLQHRRSIVF